MPTFQPPTIHDVPRFLPESTPVQKRLMRYYRPLERGHSVIKVGGHYVTVDVPDTTDLIEGRDFFLGGHIYSITDAVATALLADGYTVDTTQWNELTGTWGSYSDDTWETIG